MATLRPFLLPDGSPDPETMWINSLLIQSLYEGDITCANAYANYLGGFVSRFSSLPDHFEPDSLVIVAGGDALVVLAGTTNASQWASHLASTIVPQTDPLTPVYPFGSAVAVHSFLNGLALIENLLDTAIAPAGTGKIYITGHSYGGAGAFIYGRHLAASIPRPSRVEVMTFGEPRSFDGRAAVHEPDVHVRIIAKSDEDSADYDYTYCDPVPLTPPSTMQIVGLSFAWKTVKKWLGFIWSQHGTSYLLRGETLVAADTSFLVAAAGGLSDVSYLLAALPFGSLHFNNTSYLPRSFALNTFGYLPPEVEVLLPFFDRYQGRPSVPPANLLGGTPSAATINSAWFDPTTPVVTDADRPLWQIVGGSGFFVSTPALGGSGSMSRFKGTLAFNTIQGSFTESLISANPLETRPSMMEKMQRAMAKRCLMSITNYNPDCNNPILPQFVRVEDQLLFRDAYTLGEGGPRPCYPANSGPKRTASQNLNLELGARMAYTGGGSGEKAFVLHHGVPVTAFPVPAGTVSGQWPQSFLRSLAPTAFWMQQLQAYISQLCADGLGFNFLTGAWNAGSAPGPYSSPNSVYYNASLQMVELQWTSAGVAPNPPFFPTALVAQQPANWPNVNSKCRLQVRQWSGFQVLQGRWAAQVVEPQTGFAFALRIIRRCRQPLTPSLPFVSPLAFGTFYPGQNDPTNNTQGYPTTKIPSNVGITLNAQFQFVESKKLGKNFAEERGRARNRPT